MKKILHLLLGLGFTVILMHSGLAAPVEAKVTDWHQVELEHLVLAEATATALEMVAPAQAPALCMALKSGNYTEASKAFMGVHETRFARSSTSYDFRRRWYHQANLVSSRYYIPRHLRTKPDPGRYRSLFKVWPQG